MNHARTSKKDAYKRGQLTNFPKFECQFKRLTFNMRVGFHPILEQKIIPLKFEKSNEIKSLRIVKKPFKLLTDIC